AICVKVVLCRQLMRPETVLRYAPKWPLQIYGCLNLRPRFMDGNGALLSRLRPTSPRTLPARLCKQIYPQEEKSCGGRLLGLSQAPGGRGAGGAKFVSSLSRMVRAASARAVIHCPG